MEKLIAEADKNSGQNYLYIVPEQFTMEAQRDIVKKHPKHGTMNIDAIGLNRLAYRVFDELSVNPGQVLEDFGKSMLIQRIIMENKDSLLVYGGYGNKLGFIDEMKSMMSELFQFAVDDEAIDRAMEQLSEDGALYKKLHDVKLIYEKFNEHNMRDNCIVAEQLIDLLAEKLPESEFLRNSHLYFDGFTGFTKSQMILLEKLMGHVQSMTFAFTIDTADRLLTLPKEYELFRMTKETVSALIKAAKSANIEINDNVVLCDGTTPHRFEGSEELAVLERNLFRYPHKRYDGETYNICAVAANSARAEARYVASEIRHLVRDGGYRYSDIAVVAGDLDSVAVYYKRAMDEYGIPVFIDANVSLAGDPCTDTVRAFLGVMSENFSFDGVFRLLKSGMIKRVKTQDEEISISDTERLENYALQMKLRGYKAWSRRIEKNEGLEKTRAAFMAVFSEECIGVFKPSSPNSKASVREYTELLCDFIEEIGVYGKLEYHREKLYDEGRQDEGDAYVGIYEKVIALFDKVVTLLGDVKMTVREYADILDAGMADMKVGTVPPTVDRVVVGDMTRSRLNHVKVLLFTGMNEGVIPKPAKKGRILSAADRDRLEKQGVELAPSDRTNAYIEQFYMYTNLTKPSEKLYLLYRRQDEEMKPVNPSYIVDRIRGIFPKLTVLSYDEDGKMPETAEEAMKFVINRRQAGESCLGLDELLGELRPSGMAAIAAGENYTNVTGKLSPETVKMLYGENMSLSVSRLEKFAECQYKYFIQYGLGLREREDGDADAANIGTILHSVMQNIFVYVKENKDNDWANADIKELEAKTREFADKAADEEAGVFFDDTSRAGHMKDVIAEIAVCSVHAMKAKAQGSRMKPMYFELPFDTSARDGEDIPDGCEIRDIPEYRFDVKNGMKVSLKGVIDRIDECERGDGTVYEIVDYKSSQHKLDVDMVLAGLQMQLVTYAAIADEFEKKKLPPDKADKKPELFGMMYFEFDDPMVDIDEKTFRLLYDFEKSEKDYGIRLRNSGEGVDGEQTDVSYHQEKMLYRGMYDKSMEDDILTKKGVVIGGKDGIAAPLMRKLIEANKENIRRIAEKMSDGNISITPVIDKKKNACAYCDYKGICFFDTKYSDNSFLTMNDDEVRGDVEGYMRIKEESEKAAEAAKRLKKNKGKKTKDIESAENNSKKGEAEP